MTSSYWSNIVRGVALGDAWGDPHEFASIESITRDNPQGPEIPARLRVTDDTQMTLYLAAALDGTWGEDMATVKAAIARNFVTYRDDPDNNRAPGATVMGSLGRLCPDGSNWKSATSSHSDGSGTVMRTTPCAFLPDDRWVGITAFAAAVTHGTPNAIAAAILNVAVLRELMRGHVQPGNLVKRAFQLALYAEAEGLLDTGGWLEGYLSADQLYEGFAELARILREVLVIAEQVNDPWELQADPSHWAKMGGGWRAHETLIIALAAIDMFPTNPMSALRRAVMTDGDSDTIGAVAGGLVGAAFPGFFTNLWYGQDLNMRFEKRYREEIEEGADDTVFTDPQPLVQRRAHWRMQPHGKGNLLRKLTFIPSSWVRQLVK